MLGNWRHSLCSVGDPKCGDEIEFATCPRCGQLVSYISHVVLGITKRGDKIKNGYTTPSTLRARTPHWDEPKNGNIIVVVLRAHMSANWLQTRAIKGVPKEGTESNFAAKTNLSGKLVIRPPAWGPIVGGSQNCPRQPYVTFVILGSHG